MASPSVSTASVEISDDSRPVREVSSPGSSHLGVKDIGFRLRLPSSDSLVASGSQLRLDLSRQTSNNSIRPPTEGEFGNRCDSFVSNTSPPPRGLESAGTPESGTTSKETNIASSSANEGGSMNTDDVPGEEEKESSPHKKPTINPNASPGFSSIASTPFASQMQSPAHGANGRRRSSDTVAFQEPPNIHLDAGRKDSLKPGGAHRLSGSWEGPPTIGGDMAMGSMPGLMGNSQSASLAASPKASQSSFVNKRRRSWMSAKDNIDTILPGRLYLSGVRGAENTRLVRDLGITAFLNVAVDITTPDYVVEGCTDGKGMMAADGEQFQPGTKYGGGGVYEYLHLPIKDKGSTRLEEHFDTAFSFIERCNTAGRRVLLFCREGKSRSGSIAIAYTMYTEEQTYEQAFEYVRSCRHQVDPNLSFCSQLSAYTPERSTLYSDDGSRRNTRLMSGTSLPSQPSGDYDSLNEQQVILPPALQQAARDKELALSSPKAQQSPGNNDALSAVVVRRNDEPENASAVPPSEQLAPPSVDADLEDEEDDEMSMLISPESAGQFVHRRKSLRDLKNGIAEADKRQKMVSQVSSTDDMPSVEDGEDLRKPGQLNTTVGPNDANDNSTSPKDGAKPRLVIRARSIRPDSNADSSSGSVGLLSPLERRKSLPPDGSSKPRQ